MPERKHPYCFADDLLVAVPEFREIMEESRGSPGEDILELYRECTAWTLSDAGHWLRELRAKGDAESLSLIKRICDCINNCAAKNYEQDDMQNNIAVCLFWLLDYDDIAFFKPYLSEAVLDIGRAYLRVIDGTNTDPF